MTSKPKRVGTAQRSATRDTGFIGVDDGWVYIREYGMHDRIYGRTQYGQVSATVDRDKDGTYWLSISAWLPVPEYRPHHVKGSPCAVSAKGYCDVHWSRVSTTGELV